MSKWLHWKHGDTQIMADSPGTEPTKPTKPNFGSFGSPPSGENPIIEPANQPKPTGPIIEKSLYTEPTKPTKPHWQNVEHEFIQRFDAAVESLTIGGVELPTRRCRACNGFLFWISIHGAVVCLTCHAPAKRSLIEQWYWLPEGERKTLQ